MERFKPDFEPVYTHLKSKLLDESEFREDITLAQCSFIEEFGFIMPNESLKKFNAFRRERAGYVFKPLVSVKYFMFIAYIKLKRWKLILKKRKQSPL
jgi:hypothetical protein